MNHTTIVLYSDNTLPSALESLCQRRLFEAARGKRIVSVSQKPMSFGRNICVGDIGRSHHSLFTQALTGVKAAKTRYIALAEHDCLYTAEHFDWTPPDDGVFWYNVNHWFADWQTGQYSYHRRKVMSMLICARDLFVPAVEEKIRMIETGFEIRRGQPGACEPGVCDNRTAFIEAKARWAAFKDIGKEVPYQAQAFATEIPNIDIRHGGNFSGHRRARKTAWELPGWGRFEDVVNANLR